MTKDTKAIIVRTLMNIASENGKMTITEITKRSHITRTTIRKNFKLGISDIVEYAYLTIVDEVNEKLLKLEIENVSLTILSDILLDTFWNHKEIAHTIYSSQLPFRLVDAVSARSWDWAKNRFNKLVKEHNLSPYFSGKELLDYFNAQIISILSLWLNTAVPVSPNIFKPKFLYLMSISTKNLIYKDIND